MRIVVSGTHASGKSTLVGDFAVAHRSFTVLPDPFELIDTALDAPDAATYLAQLRLSADRLIELEPGEEVIAERGPLDFLAYLSALEDLGRIRGARQTLSRAGEVTAEAMTRVDLLVLLPLTAGGGIRVPEDEDPDLRAAMSDALLELADDPDLTGGAAIVEIAGAPTRRLELLERAVSDHGR